ncbi:hypothetical protein RFI_02186 [Reticulomyxa filosa]|uniref:Uncharacterized protein n=1 Tax=Reticulomyxa filosa TaxID=46433 RepID=X6P9X0_RETFI|nr:hypothetical protein RFI_02186 [Reticulomyxa filosa]|eukprot:ETO34903.1 hypothetical protein RFI_02186 [Reticulomyxa filosa]
MCIATNNIQNNEKSNDESVDSVCKLLCALCCFEEGRKLFDEHNQLQEQNRASTNKNEKKLLASKIANDPNWKTTTDTILSNVTRSQLSRIAIAMIGEATARECAIYVNKDQDTMWKYLKACLGIKPNSIVQPTPDELPEPMTIVHSEECDWEKARRHSARFFAYNYGKTNCTPHAIVACIGFMKAIYQFISDTSTSKDKNFTLWDILVCKDVTLQTQIVDYIFQQFSKRRISMKSFITKFLPDVDPVHVQIALYVQGLRYHTSQARREGLPELIHPVFVVKEMTINTRRYMYECLVKLKVNRIHQRISEAKKNSRHHRLILEQNEFRLSHGGMLLPKIFTQTEVNTLNLNRFVILFYSFSLCKYLLPFFEWNIVNRGKQDQLELLDNGLLKHHCCFEKCPLFLVNLSTSSDKILGTRHGLFRHLKYFLIPANIGYVRGIHNYAYRFVRNYKTKFGLVMWEVITKDESKRAPVLAMFLTQVCESTEFCDNHVIKHLSKISENWLHHIIFSFP